jgi:hypothetical protein
MESLGKEKQTKSAPREKRIRMFWKTKILKEECSMAVYSSYGE